MILDLLTPCTNIHSGSKAKRPTKKKCTITQFNDIFPSELKKAKQSLRKSYSKRKKGKFQQQETGRKLLEAVETYLNTSESKGKMHLSCALKRKTLWRMWREKNMEKKNPDCATVCHMLGWPQPLPAPWWLQEAQRSEAAIKATNPNRMKPLYVLHFTELGLVRCWSSLKSVRACVGA